MEGSGGGRGRPCKMRNATVRPMIRGQRVGCGSGYGLKRHSHAVEAEHCALREHDEAACDNAAVDDGEVYGGHDLSHLVDGDVHGQRDEGEEFLLELPRRAG